ncbi:MAG: hypothetical protein ABJE66_07015 [Deltaproteobacteria bacterium]
MTRSLALVLLASCGGAPPVAAEKPGPRGLRADQHAAMASREDERASQLDTWPEQRPGPIEGPDTHLVTVAWTGRWDTSEEHRRLAAVHRSAAAELDAEYQEACGSTSAELVMVSPLQRYGLGGGPTERGANVILTAEAGPPARLLGELRCHRAWMMLGPSDMNACPLDLPGLHVYAHGDATSIELELVVDDPKLIPELQRRTVHDLELANHRVKAPTSPTKPD